jgi:hypothetical protein
MLPTSSEGKAEPSTLKTKEITMKIWRPTLDDSKRNLGEALEEMLAVYGDQLSKIPMSMKILENPLSPVHLPGAVSLRRHDLIHILIGCDTTLEGEHFIVGFTMGAAQRLRPWHVSFFKWFVMHCYPVEYRSDGRGWKLFDLGVEMAGKMGVKDLHKAPLEKRFLQQSIESGRAQLGIDIEMLKAFYAEYFQGGEEE